jgi:hypothetical protein
VTEDQLSVRLEWPERSTVPFRPPTDEAAEDPASHEEVPAADRLTALERSVDLLQVEVTRLRAEVARLSGSAARERGPRSDPSTARPIKVRSRATRK